MRSILLICTVVITATACAAAMSVSSHERAGLDWSSYRSFAWGPADALPTGDPRLDSDPFFNDRLQGAVERQLAGRGLSLSPGPAELSVHYHANISERIEAQSLDRTRDYCSGVDCSGSVRYYEAGTIVIDVIDTRTQRLVWRGWAQTAIAQALDDRERLSELIDRAAARVIARFPRAPTTAGAREP